MINTITTQLAIYCMLFSAFYLARITRQEQEQSLVQVARASDVPRTSSLVGVDSSGHVRRPSLDGKKLANNGRIVLFVLHTGSALNDIRYWNTVQTITGRTNDTSTQFWGICDAGHDCDVYQSTADFTIIGYLDPQQMRIAADAGAKGDSLLYGNDMMLKAVVHNVPEPASEATLIRLGVTNKK